MNKTKGNNNLFWTKKPKDDDNRLGIFGIILIFIFYVLKEIFVSGHLIHFIFIIFLLFIGYFIFKFIEKYKKDKPATLGKEFEKKYPILIQYNPPQGINAAEAGLLYNRKVDPTDLTSLIYQWAFEGYIDIKTFKGENSKKEFIKLIKKSNLPTERPLFESEIFNSIFTMGDVKVFEGAFQLRYALMLEDLEYHGINKGWLKHGKKYKLINLGDIGYFIITYVIILLFGYILFWNSMNFSLIINSFLIFGVIFIIAILIYGFMDGGGSLTFTDKGAKLASHIIGYRNFIKSCDENKIKFFLKEDPLFIDRTLPYATAFGLETEFLKKVSPLKGEWNAKYIRGKKVSTWAGVIRFLFKSDNDSLL